MMTVGKPAGLVFLRKCLKKVMEKFMKTYAALCWIASQKTYGAARTMTAMLFTAVLQ